MKNIRLLLCDCFFGILFIAICVLFRAYFKHIIAMSLVVIGNLYFLSKVLRGIILLIDLKRNPAERDAVIYFSIMDKLDWFPSTKYYKVYLEDMRGKKIGKYLCFDDEIFDELHLGDSIHMHYYPRSRVIVRIEKRSS